MNEKCLNFMQERLESTDCNNKNRIEALSLIKEKTEQQALMSERYIAQML